MKFRVILFVSILAFSLSACLSLAEDITPPPGYIPPTPVPTMSALFPDSVPDVAQGAATFAEKCAPCHGPTGLGDGPQASMLPVNVPVLALPEISRRAAPSQWYTIVTRGNLDNFMPGFASLTDQERWNVVAYAHSLSTSSDEIEAGKAIYEANCALCHGPDGKSAPTANFSDLQWLASRSLDQFAASVRSGMAPGMPAFEGKLDDAQIYASLAYARTFAYTAPVSVASADSAAPTPDAAVAEETPAVTDPQAEGSLPPAAPLDADTVSMLTGQFSGQISIGSGGDLPSGLKVVLHGFDHGGEGSFSEILTLESVVDADGRYVFENVEIPEGRAFYVSLNYAGTEYSSEAAFVQDGLTTFDLPIQVYETVADPSLLEIAQAHILLDFTTPEKVTVIHFFAISNPSDKTIVAPAEGGMVVQFALPQGFENLQFEEGILGGRFLSTPDGFGDTLNVVPGDGQYQLVFAYDLPYTPSSGISALFGGGATELSLPLSLKANSVTVLVPEGVMVSGSGFEDAGLQSMGGGTNFQMYRAGVLDAGKNLTFNVSGSPASAAIQTGSANTNQNILIGVGSLGLVLIAVGGYLFWRDRRRTEEEEQFPDEDVEADDDEEEAELDEDEILDAIVALDDQFKAGNIAEAAYRERRTELKAQLKKLG